MQASTCRLMLVQILSPCSLSAATRRTYRSSDLQASPAEQRYPAQIGMRMFMLSAGAGAGHLTGFPIYILANLGSVLYLVRGLGSCCTFNNPDITSGCDRHSDM